MHTTLTSSLVRLFVLVAAVSVAAAACSGRDTSSPVTPSSSPTLSAASHGNSGGGSGHDGSGSSSGNGSGSSGSGSGSGGDDHRGGSDRNEVEATGTIAGRTGGCPALTFSIGSTTFMTNAATLFPDPCTAIVNGAVVEVKGNRQANGTVLVTRIEVADNEDDEENEVEVSGTIAGKAGGCPTLTFSIGATMLRTDAATRFRDTTCAALANGSRVEVKGTREAAGRVLATRIQMED